MKRSLGLLVAVAFAFAASAAYAQATANPAAPAAEKKVEATPAVKPAEKPATSAGLPQATTKEGATEVCKKKGLVGLALDECVKNELAKAPAPKAPEATPAAKADAPKATAYPTAKPVETKTEATKPAK